MNVHSFKFEDRERGGIFICEAEADKGIWHLSWSPESLTLGASAGT